MAKGLWSEACGLGFGFREQGEELAVKDLGSRVQLLNSSLSVLDLPRKVYMQGNVCGQRTGRRPHVVGFRVEG